VNILQVNYTDLPGRRFNGYDLLAGLRTRGVRCRQAVLSKVSANAGVVSLWDDAQDGRLQQTLHNAEGRLSMDNLLYPWGRVLAGTPDFRGADVVHFHLVHGRMISLFDLPWLSMLKPSVWTLHDAWALTGHCIQPGTCTGWLEGCTACPSLEADVPLHEDRADRMWRIKRRVFAESDLDIVVASEFMLDMVSRSPITEHITRVHLVPFGIDVSTFRDDLGRSASRKLLGIGEDDFVVFFRAAPSPDKGLAYIKAAFGSRPPSRPTTLLTVDRRGLVGELASEYRIVDLGWVEDQSLYPHLYSACDVFLMPSTAEGFGLMALEAMASGRPVVCFEGTTLPSVTHAPECGIAVESRDAGALRDALDWLAGTPEEAERRGRLGRRIAVEHFGQDRYLDTLTSLYASVRARSHRQLS
jgi:glycosyltransferase involved in cell wall biosynthesis